MCGNCNSPTHHAPVCRVSSDGKPNKGGQAKRGKPPTGAANVTTMSTENVDGGDDESSPDAEGAPDLPVTTNHFGRMYY